MIPLLISAKMKSAHPPKQVKIQNMPPLPPSRPPPDWGKTLCSAKTFHILIAELDFCKSFKIQYWLFTQNLASKVFFVPGICHGTRTLKIEERIVIN